MNTSGHLVLITGAGTGMGLEAAKQFTRRSSRVLMVARNEQRLRREANRLDSCRVRPRHRRSRSGRRAARVHRPAASRSRRGAPERRHHPHPQAVRRRRRREPCQGRDVHQLPVCRPADRCSGAQARTAAVAGADRHYVGGGLRARDHQSDLQRDEAGAALTRPLDMASTRPRRLEGRGLRVHGAARRLAVLGRVISDQKMSTQDAVAALFDGLERDELELRVPISQDVYDALRETSDAAVRAVNSATGG